MRNSKSLPTRRWLAKAAAIIATAGVMFTVAAVPAQASTWTYDGRDCGALYVYTKSKTAGTTSHRQLISGGWVTQNFGYVYPSSPYRTMSKGFKKMDQWKLTADVKEYGLSGCVRPG